MSRSLVLGEPGSGEIWVLRVRRRWIVRVAGEDIAIRGDKGDAISRAFSIAQLGDDPQEVVIFASDGSVEGRRTFRP